MHWTVLQRPVELAAFIRHYPIGRLGEAEYEILAQENFDYDLAKQEREESRSHDKVFVSVYASARAGFDTVAASGAQMPRGVARVDHAVAKQRCVLDAREGPLRPCCEEARG
jgi:hypothetical protein